MSESDNQFSLPATICKDCVFATWDGNKQVGCEFGRLEKLADRGASIDFVSEGGKDYFLIHDRVCMTVRNEEWADRQEDTTQEGLRAAVMAEIRPRVHMIVYVPDGCDHGSIDSSVQSVLNQTMRPYAITVVFGEGHPGAFDEVRKFSLDRPPFAWNVVQMTPDPELSNDYPGEFYRAIDEAVSDSNAVFYTAAHAGFAWDPQFIEKLDRAVNVDIRRFLAVRPAHGEDGGLHMMIVHGDAMGNRGETLINKLEDAIKEYGRPELVIDYEEL